MPIRICYEKTIENNKIVFYSQHFQSFWEYIQKDGYSTLFMPVFFASPIIFLIMEILITGKFDSAPIGNVVIILSVCLAIIIFLLWQIVKAKNFFFELTVSKKEISFYTPRQQWIYKVADIKKLGKKKVYGRRLCAYFFYRNRRAN